MRITGIAARSGKVVIERGCTDVRGLVTYGVSVRLDCGAPELVEVQAGCDTPGTNFSGRTHRINPLDPSSRVPGAGLSGRGRRTEHEAGAGESETGVARM